MNASIAVAAAATLILAACASAPPPPAASIMPSPTDKYLCESGTKLSVRLLGEAAEVSVDGAETVSLAALGNDGTTFTNGRQTLFVKQGVVSWAVGRMAAEACKPG
ncbi:hypothetical protein HHL11_10065 [Ramlibacter sp. G-1-2-2]|uniref:C-type lysozyme inhibitor domain-containing protein n=1 Tax=Ramlibacter agri TaxID=2728837 RepID=A0A848H0J6_9BURK|nr:hypothetical protein [Ramlibacter agri]NML44094.1 hypothetical protein [Ramlibacter agri]